MLPKENRLTKKKDFDIVFKEGKSVKGEFLLVKILKSHLKKSRFGFIVSKKISNKAVERNKIKRRLRKAFSDRLKSFSGSLDVVIIALPGILEKNFSEIEQAIAKLFKNLHN